MTIKAMSRQERRASEKLKRSGKTPYGGATAAIAAQFQSAVNLHRAGRFPEAEAAYRTILSHEPDHPHALNVLGILACETGRPQMGLDLIRQAIGINGQLAEYHTNLSEAAAQCGHVGEALEAAKQALKVDRRSARAHLALGNAYRSHSQGALAIESYRNALGIAPDDYQSQANFAACCAEFGVTKLDAVYEALLVRALDQGWTRPNMLVQGIVPALKQDAAVVGLLDAAAAPDSKARLAAALADGTVAKAMCRPLVIRVLKGAPIGDPFFETLVTRLRRVYLEAVDAGRVIGASDLEVLAAIAQMAFMCDYALIEDDDDSLIVQRLSKALATDDPAPALIAAIAAYRPLSDLGLTERSISAPPTPILADLWRLQITEPLTDRRRVESIPALTAIATGVSEEVRAQYEQSPYPRWTQINMRPTLNSLRTYLRRTFGNIPLPDGNEILIAGCGTGQESVELAMKCRKTGETILAVDLSLPSLAYAIRSTEALGLSNIRYAQADITMLDRLDDRFDIITSNGVLHHLADPAGGWRKLKGLLKPKGLMQISLYSEIGRRAVVAAREMIAAHGWNPVPADMRAARKAIMALPAEHPAAGVLQTTDFYNLNMCRDLLFHVQEHRFTLPLLGEVIEGLGLRFLGFDASPLTYTRYRVRFPDDPTMTRLGNWDVFERENPTTFGTMYQFWVASQG